MKETLSIYVHFPFYFNIFKPTEQKLYCNRVILYVENLSNILHNANTYQLCKKFHFTNLS